MSHTFFQTAQGEREHRIPRSGEAQVEECRMPFIGPLNGGNAAYPVPETL